ncbi:MAG: hypothetical protein JXO22_14360 [Phycisphaerae bacterium]|nr:hypothetical protein [Phycisphaerae bacterium]
MKRTATTFRCLPRLGLDYTELRVVDLDVCENADEAEIHAALTRWFAHRGIADAVYDVAVDNDGPYAIINDEAYAESWGTPLV